ncbi:MAG: UvrD-helicase domain-containing protein [Anaerolineaceae bacterium]|nr:UvrD-helicase domain-containing protein [Anaerolineaceae bacterium]
MSLTREQLAAVQRLDENLCLTAGAGTGKTRVLVERFLGLMALGAYPEHLAAITFTEKAAAEMVTRLRERCREEIESAATADQRRQWQDRLSGLASGTIGTIHGFCTRLLRQHPVEAGLDPRFEVLSTAERRRLAGETGETITATLQRLFDEGDQDLLTVTRAYTLPTVQSLLAEALADREKVQRSAALHDRPIPEQIEALRSEVEAQQRAALDELLADEGFARDRDFLTAVQGPEGDGREESRLLALEAMAMVESGKDLAERIDGLIALAGLDFRRRGSAGKWANPELYKEVSRALKSVREAARAALKQCDFAPPETWEQHLVLARAVSRVAGRIIADFQQAKSDLGMLDFDDLLIMTRDLLRDNRKLRRRIGRRYRQILVDELQDTNLLQTEILALLLGDDGAGMASLRPGSFFGVGDPKQSIYRFRGADVEVFRRIAGEFDRDSTARLTRTFRFHEGLAQTTNAMFEPLLGRDFVALSADDQRRPPVSMQVLLVADHKDLKAEDLRHREAARIARWISDTVAAKSKPPATYGDIAILMHRQTQIYAYEEALKQCGIPFYVVGGRHFYDQQEVRDVIAAMQAIRNPGDDLAVATLLRGPLVGLSDDALCVLCSEKPLAAALESGRLLKRLSESDAAKAGRASRWMAHFTQRAGRVGIAQLLQEIVFDGYCGDDGRPGCPAPAHVLLPQFLGRRRYANLRRLVEMARRFDHSGRSRLEDFLEQVEAGQSEGVEEAEAPLAEEGSDAVLLMTVHRAKGLEFPYVILADSGAARRTGGAGRAFHISESLGLAPRKPDRQRDEFEPAAYTLMKHREARAESEEFKRLFYVAATRARQRLILSGSQRIDGDSWLDYAGRMLGVDLAGAECGQQTVEAAPGAKVMVDVAEVEPLRKGAVARRGKVAALFADGELNVAALEALTSEAANAKFLGRLRDQVAPVPEGGATVTVSATSLADYARCPALFYLKHVLGLKAPRSDGCGGSPGGPDAAAVGTIVHECLEGMDRMSCEVPQETIERLVGRHCRIRPSERPSAIERVVALTTQLRSMPLAAELASAKKALREVPFVIDLKGVTVSGKIDLLYKDAGGQWTLVDYKTDRIGPEDVAKHALGHRYQLRVYIEAAENFLGVNLDRAFLAFLNPGILQNMLGEARAVELLPLVEGIHNRCFAPLSPCSRPCPFAEACGKL